MEVLKPNNKKIENEICQLKTLWGNEMRLLCSNIENFRKIRNNVELLFDEISDIMNFLETTKN